MLNLYKEYIKKPEAVLHGAPKCSVLNNSEISNHMTKMWENVYIKCLKLLKMLLNSLSQSRVSLTASKLNNCYQI